ncbi:multidrug ABC transporter ATP-binding protein [Paenibacillus darwinianus]|uniref:Multidrug ABC transporter ATP-binding protein n=1 Tax=Paenibacillus darwinianus TaxID=1380763 RepID=A0A9W5RYP2_9BACL|nr:ABC transporter ATP-binding protein [Paenibacillus darwinianus]EXX84736.1 multidrug ABC transporter ATP-binding protein [Paenibacillus darwinianus]EXX86504.1 multidrug ABC transporter ATP-binding protein [Paenibacillus darwinianus]EXX87622.1 multidrug ABC transporter ATP-binding protein [Paenibacillus darwinianus]
MDIFRQLKPYYWPDRRLLALSIFALMCTTALGLAYPNMLRILIDDVIRNENYGLVPALSLTVVGVIALKASMQFVHGLTGGRLGNRVSYRLRNSLYKKLQYLSFQYYDTAKTGDLMSRLTADLEAIRNFVGFGFAQILNMFLMVIFGGAMMLSIHWQLTLVTFVSIPFLVFTALKFERKIHPEFREMRQAMSKLTTAVQENITGVRTVKSFAREGHEVEKFSLRNEEYKANQIGVAFTWGSYFPVMELLASLCVVVLLVFGGSLVIRGSLSLGELVAFFSMTWYIVGPMWGLGFHINNYTQSKASGERVLELLNQHIHVKDAEHALSLPDDVQGHVRFDNVSFHYPDKAPAVKNLSLDAPPGTVIGLLGATGSGKSTVIQLLMRAYNVQEGRITLDGRDIRNLSLESLRSQIAPVFQETFLFSASIRENIAYGVAEIDMDAVIRAAKLAKAHDFITELPLGYDTVVGERGMGLSGGQKQRIAIARALLRNPRILILDDSTSAVDMETEHEIQAGFKEVMAGRTTFIIAHRISSLRHADEIIVLNRGAVIQRGTHDELIAVPGHYRDTYDIQYADRPGDGDRPDRSKAERRVAK